MVYIRCRKRNIPHHIPIMKPDRICLEIQNITRTRNRYEKNMGKN